jgi:hypothetical protein
VDKRVLIGMGSGWNILSKTTQALVNAFISGFSCPVGFKVIESIYPDFVSTELVKEAKTLNFTHIFFLDSDVIFAPWAIQQMFEHDEMVIGAQYRLKGENAESTMLMFDVNGPPFHPRLEQIPRKVFKCAGVPGGFKLIDLKVFDLIQPPWYVNGYNGNTDFITCDVYFDRKVTAAGVDIWCDGSIKVIHEGLYGY